MRHCDIAFFGPRLIFCIIFLAVLGRKHEGEGDGSAGAQGADVCPNQGDETAGQVRGDESELSKVRETSKLSDVAGGDERLGECKCVPRLILRKPRSITLPEGTLVKRVSCSEMVDIGLAKEQPQLSDAEMRDVGVEKVLKQYWSEPETVDVDDVDGCVKDIAR